MPPHTPPPIASPATTTYPSSCHPPHLRPVPNDGRSQVLERLHEVASARRAATLELTDNGFLEKEKARRAERKAQRLAADGEAEEEEDEDEDKDEDDDDEGAGGSAAARPRAAVKGNDVRAPRSATPEVDDEPERVGGASGKRVPHRERQQKYSSRDGKPKGVVKGGVKGKKRAPGLV
jgi:hypothetical protein